jgi:hypothetical protein
MWRLRERAMTAGSDLFHTDHFGVVCSETGNQQCKRPSSQPQLDRLNHESDLVLKRHTRFDWLEIVVGPHGGLKILCNMIARNRSVIGDKIEILKPPMPGPGCLKR